METHSRKQAEASSSAPSSSHPSKRSGFNHTNPPFVATRTSSRSNLSSAATIVAAATNNNIMSPSPPAAPTPPPSAIAPPAAKIRGRSASPHPPPSPAPSSDSREAKRLLGLTFNVVVPTEDDIGLLHHNLSSASSALQGLLRKLHAGLDDLLPSSDAPGADRSSHQSGRMKKILSRLRTDGEEGKQVEALTQLCEILSIGIEDSLGLSR